MALPAIKLDVIIDFIKKIPPKRRKLLVGVIYFLCTAAYVASFLVPAFSEKTSLETKLAELQKQVTEKERLAAQKGKYVRELAELNEALKTALTKLPAEKEIPGLLYAVAQAGKDSGINFILFEPKSIEKPPIDAKAAAQTTPAPAPGAKPADPKAKPKEEKFYEEIPVKVTVNGSFHSTAGFFDKVARLPRIVNIEEISMSEVRDPKVRVRSINTSCVIKTYMFIEKMDEKKADGKK